MSIAAARMPTDTPGWTMSGESTSAHEYYPGLTRVDGQSYPTQDTRTRGHIAYPHTFLCILVNPVYMSLDRGLYRWLLDHRTCAHPPRPRKPNPPHPPFQIPVLQSRDSRQRETRRLVSRESEWRGVSVWEESINAKWTGTTVSVASSSVVWTTTGLFWISLFGQRDGDTLRHRGRGLSTGTCWFPRQWEMQNFLEEEVQNCRGTDLSLTMAPFAHKPTIHSNNYIFIEILRIINKLLIDDFKTLSDSSMLSRMICSSDSKVRPAMTSEISSWLNSAIKCPYNLCDRAETVDLRGDENGQPTPAPFEKSNRLKRSLHKSTWIKESPNFLAAYLNPTLKHRWTV